MNWLLDADIHGFFEAIDHGWLVKFVEHRIAEEIPPARVLHPWPDERFDVCTRGKSPVR